MNQQFYFWISSPGTEKIYLKNVCTSVFIVAPSTIGMNLDAQQ